MANSQSLPLCEKKPLKINTLQRAQEIAILFLFICLLVYRLLSLTDHGFVWLLAFLCESWFAFNWVLTLNTQWTPVEYKTYPQNLLQQVQELPAVDMFVATADAELEPPIITVNTVLSLLAVDYPSHKLACYVSDDGCSPLTLYSLTEASKFAQFWVPFCKKYNIQVRAPFRYFSGNSKLPSDNPIGFLQEWTKMKDEYQKLCQKIEDAVQNLATLDFSGDYVDFAHIDRRNHSTIIKVISENKERLSNGLPHLVYVAREKRPNHSHHYKAGAMNALTRVSGVMTNAPFMLNVDCDMYANNSKIVLHAMCLLLGFKHEKEGAFVQYPQMFYDTLKDDPFGNQLVLPLKTSWPGFAGMQGPLYAGTGCFHRRKVIYGFSFMDSEGNLRDVALDQERFGNSTELIESATHTLSEKIDHPHDLSGAVEAANKVAGSSYEHNTLWGTKVGWVYGSVTEDILTGMKIHARGWKSILCMPDPPGFVGSAPSSSHIMLTQRKRWVTGLLEILFSKNSPIFATLYAKLEFRQCLAYTTVLIWGLKSIPDLCYTILPAYCIITNSHFLPKVKEPALIIFVAVFLLKILYTLRFYLGSGLSINQWWNQVRMGPEGKIPYLTTSLFGVVTVVFKLLGISEVAFEVTQKDQNSSSSDDQEDDANAGRFTFDESPIYVPATTLLFVHFTALTMGLFGMQPPAHGADGAGLGEMMCCVWVVLCLWPFLKGLFGKGKYGIPMPTIFKSAVLALLFMHFCGRIPLPLRR
ncbi:cellulose synthase-like protein H1 isoform X3 [Prunus yedoensis var. nudiflora]|uniref:Cellulose synthase-like protein H1 isoform X3 n=1 Tax=Prunus yedoensis var. nudiflora TaxID=2094558 RepID=A0A314Y8Z6_PRUYE|nr:cellulose synthase-like protein H1 isoform X3 [Prunus yedoensis var. nudiflora]